MAKPAENDSAETSDLAPEVHLPGLDELRRVVSEYGRGLIPSGKAMRKDGVAGLTVAISAVPEGMAGGLLAGTNPIYGLYANLFGAVVGGIFSSTKLMVIQNTSAVSLVAGQSLVGFSAQERDSALFLMVTLAGVFATVFGLFRLGRLTRFVSHSVMTGFITGIALILILSQLPTLAGHQVEGSNRITQVIELLRNIHRWDIASVLVGLSTLGFALLFERTPLRGFAGLLAIAIPSALVAGFNLQPVELVRSLGEIPQGLPAPALPSFARLLEVAGGALAVAVIVLVQGAGVSQSVPNPDGSTRRISQDFIAQGLANVASGLFRGLPVGGSVSSTALNVMSGATRRWGGIFSGLWTAVILIALPGLIGYVAMPALGALIILAGFRSIKPTDLQTVWQAGWAARLAAIITLVAMLLLPIQLAIALGVAVSTLLYVSEAASDISLIELKERPDGQAEEYPAPSRLPTNAVTVLDVYGPLFFAGARTLERLLPSPEGSQNSIVILRLRGRGTLGATLAQVLFRYIAKLQEVNGRLYLTGLSQQAHAELTRLRELRLTGPLRIFEATSIRGQSTRAAHAEAAGWLVAHSGEDPNVQSTGEGRPS
jgi:SulP family sulfate permease